MKEETNKEQKETFVEKLVKKLKGPAFVLELLSIIGAEYGLALIFRKSNCCTGVCVLAIAFIIAALCFIFLKKKEVIKAKIELNDFRKLFQNLVSKWQSILLLLYFLIHLEWVSNISYDAFFGGEGCFWGNIILTLAGLLAIYLSLLLFPPSETNKPAHERTLLFCGLSLSRGQNGFEVSPRNIDLLLKPLLNEEWPPEKSQKLKRIVIFPSTPCLTFAKLSTEKEREDIFNYSQNKKLFDQYNDIVDKHNTYGKTQECGQKTLVELIKAITGKEIEVCLSEPVDYDNMDKALSVITAELKKYETNSNGRQITSDTLLYISPGTGVIGSALTAFAVPGSRLVLYFTQTKEDNHLINIGLKTGVNDSIMSELINNE